MARLILYLKLRAWRWYTRRWLSDPDECTCGACFPLE